MNDVPSQTHEDGAIDRAAAQWVLRQDRGLSAVEQDELSQWLAADPRHRDALATHRWGWDELDRLAGVQSSVDAIPDPDLLARRRPARVLAFRVWLPLAAAAAIALGLFGWQSLRPPAPAPVARPAAAFTRIEERTLEDGSVLTLNRGAVVTTQFTPGERRVQLVRGEVHFAVAKDTARPFIVSAAGVDVRAVGTAFNVRLGATAVEVLVTEGRVKVLKDSRTQDTGGGKQGAGNGRQETGGGVVSPVASHLSPEISLEAGQGTFVPLAPSFPALSVATMTPEQITRQLAWQPRLLDFTDEPLADIVAEFNARNPVRLVIGDPSLAARRLSAAFRSDNVEGFVRLMESDFGMTAEWHGDTEIVLRRGK